MILNCPSIIVQRSVPKRAVCVASAATSPNGINTEQLREQLDDLHKEAEFTRAKGENSLCPDSLLPARVQFSMELCSFVYLVLFNFFAFIDFLNWVWDILKGS